MRRGLAVLMFVFCFLSCAEVSHATVLTFEDLYPGSMSIAPIEPGYAGFSWGSRAYVMASDYNLYSGYATGTIGTTNLFTINSGGGAYDLSMTRIGGTFTLNGAYLTSAWMDSLNVTVEGWASGSKVYTKTVNANDSAPSWFDFDFYDVETVWFRPLENGDGIQAEHLVLDNITINEVENATVPEPATLLLFGLGSVGVAFRKRFIKS
ncbi:MAG: PEP-CTERM sorting domain-containing protein [Candidatus Omnitrophota bacterium]